MLLQLKICVSARVSKSFAKCLFVWIKRFEDPSRKMKSPVIIDTDHSFIQMVKYSFLDKKIVYQSFYGAPLTFSVFFCKEKFHVLARIGKSFLNCLLSEPFWRSSLKKLYLWFYLAQMVHFNCEIILL